MSGQDAIRIIVSPELRALLDRGTDKSGQVRLLKRSVPAHARPTLAAVLARAPVLKGQLQASLGITTKTNPQNGEVYSIVGIRDNVVVWSGGTKTLFSSLKIKRSARMAANRGAGAISRRTAFKYIRGLETGVRANGKIARRAGGTKMIERGASDTADGFIDGVSADMFDYLLNGGVG